MLHKVTHKDVLYHKRKNRYYSQVAPVFIHKDFSLLYFLHDSFESLWIIHGKVGEHLTVNLNTSLSKLAHQYRIAHSLLACSCVNTLNPQGAEIAFLIATITIGVGQTFLPCVLGYCPNILAGSKIAAGKLQNSLALCS